MHAVERDYEVSVSPSTAASSLFDMPMRQPKEATSIFDYSSIFFARVSNIVGKFHEGSGVVLEWVVGDVFDFCVEVAKKKEERRKEGMAFMFDRMYFSNVPYVDFCFIFFMFFCYFFILFFFKGLHGG